MRLSWNTSLRTTVCAAALLTLGWAQAQTPAPAGAEVTHPHVHPASKAKPHHHGHQPHHQGPKHPYATPAQHEAAAARHEQRQGKGPSNHGAQLNEFERNALRRCEVFKIHEDRQACVERVRNPQISGSVAGGGVIREYTQTVQVPPPPPPAHHPVPHAPVR